MTTWTALFDRAADVDVSESAIRSSLVTRREGRADETTNASSESES